jgi:hypothetical protein
MTRPSVLHDPEVMDEVIEKLALGMPQVLIAQSLGIAEPTLSNWKKRKDFRKKFALKCMEVASDPVKAIMKHLPLAWLERHPEFRKQFAPPGKDAPQTAKIIVEIIGSDTAPIKVIVDE